MKIAESMWFMFEPILSGDGDGDVRFYSAGVCEGSLVIGDAVFHHGDAFEHRFAGGYVARGPGSVDCQEIVVTIGDEAFSAPWRHCSALGRRWFGDRPIIEIEDPLGKRSHYQYQPIDAFNSLWHRVVPIPQMVGDISPVDTVARLWQRPVWLLMALIAMLAMYAYCTLPFAGLFVLFTGRR